MITKAKKLQFTSSDGSTHETIEDAKRVELMMLTGVAKEAQAEECLAAIAKHAREAIAILRFGLPRKPRTAKPKASRGRRAAAVNAALQDMKQ